MKLILLFFINQQVGLSLQKQLNLIKIKMYKSKYQIKQGRVEQWCNRQLYSVSSLKFKLKPMQKAIIICNQSNDILVNLPTGYGKSMLYQYQALLPHSKSIIVIVPLKALLWDSIVEANQLGISAAELSPENIDKFDLQFPPKLLFVTPERLYQNYTAYQTVVFLAQRNKIGLFVIDEAHCVCEWGNDFRKDYAKLSSLRQDFPNVRILAMTATAPPQIRAQITQKLKIQNCYFFFASYNRPNLVYEVMKISKQGLKQNIQSLIKQQFPGQSGIIYCQTIKLCQQLHSQLKTSMKCQMFHSKISVNKRQRILNEFKNLPGKIIIATICFGMGINKPDVRFVIHAGISFSIENYYQESGRGGRDGLPARCILMSYPEQESTLLYLLDQTKKQYKTNSSIFKNRKFQLDTMLRYSMNKTECRKKYMFRIMGEDYGDCKQYCDICLQGGKIQQEDFTEKGIKIINCLVESNSILTLVELRNILKGKSMQKKKKYDGLKGVFGMLKSLKQEEIMEIIQELINENYFNTIVKRNKFGMTKRIIVNKRKPITRILITKSAKPQAPLKKDKMADYIQKRKGSAKEINPLFKQNNIQPIGTTKEPVPKKKQNTTIQYPEYLGSMYDGMYDDMCQGVILSSDYYDNQVNLFEQQAEEGIDSHNVTQNAQTEEKQDDEQENEQNQPPEIDQHDIHNIMPWVQIEVSDNENSYTENFFYSRNQSQKNEPEYIEKINGVWCNVKKPRNNQEKIPQSEKISKVDDLKQHQAQKQDIIKKTNEQQVKVDKVEIVESTDHDHVLQNIMLKYGVKPKQSLKRQTQLPDKKEIEEELKKHSNKKKFNFL